MVFASAHCKAAHQAIGNRLEPEICAHPLAEKPSPQSYFNGRLSILGYAVVYAACVQPMAKIIRSGHFDIVHTILPYSYAFGAWANRRAGASRPLIMSRLSPNWYQKSDWLLGWLERRVLHPSLSAAICNSQAIARELEAEGISKSKIRVIYNGIDAPAYSTLMVARRAARAQLGVGGDDLVFSSVANLYPYKGHADLLRALHKIVARLPRAWMLLVAGRDIDGNRAHLTELRNRLGLASHVRFLGERLDVPIILSAADIHVSASHIEGLPNNIVEAMCGRLPVVAAAVGGVPELIVDGATGLLVPAGDIDALGNALLALADDSESRARMGVAGHERVTVGFSVHRSTSGWSNSITTWAFQTSIRMRPRGRLIKTACHAADQLSHADLSLDLRSAASL